jgi:hypothetical protein
VASEGKIPLVHPRSPAHVWTATLPGIRSDRISLTSPVRLVARMSARTVSSARSSRANRSGSCSNPGPYPRASRNAIAADASRVPSSSVTVASASSRASTCSGRYSSSFMAMSNAACRSTVPPSRTAKYSASRRRSNSGLSPIHPSSSDKPTHM